jgi:hypothetical protein
MITLTPLIEIPGFMYGHSHDHNHTKNTEPPTNPSNPHCHLQG